MSLAEIQERDRKKIAQAEKLSITLIRIPFWWDFREDRYILFIHYLYLCLLCSNNVSYLML